jgi:hypothetical protein
LVPAQLIRVERPASIMAAAISATNDSVEVVQHDLHEMRNSRQNLDSVCPSDHQQVGHLAPGLPSE